MTHPALRFQQLVKRYAGKPVLDGIDLDIGVGECVGLVGINGAGKTSLIKCLLDFVAIDGGSIEILGRTHRHSAARAPLVFLPERFQPPWFLTGAAFLKTMMTLHGRAHDAGLVERECGLLGLPPDALRKPVRQQSKGTSQKLGLAACFLSGKRTFVLDEPMSGLDPEARVLFKTRLRGAIDGGATVFFSSHQLADVEELCDRMAILHDGRMRYVGTPAHCRDTHGAATLEAAFMRVIR